MSRHNIPTPEEFFGARPGTDRLMIHWNDLCAYYRHLATLTDRLEVVEMGKTTEGNDFLMLYISAADNLKNLEKYREISLKLQDPRGLSQKDIEALADEGCAVCMQNYGIHSNEVGGPQCVPLIVHDLVTAEEGALREILDNVIFILCPCGEPDGEIIFTEWYKKWLGTAYEGCYSPYLRHNYAGHSNNRDAINESVVESTYLNDMIFRNWGVQVYQDFHHQCPHDPRMSIGPLRDPIHPAVCPLTQREDVFFASEIAMALSRAGRRGIVAGDERFSDYAVTTFYNTARMHNVCGMLAESADAAIASPIYVKKEWLDMRQDPTSECVDVWEGGEWHLSDIVEQIYIASFAMLTAAAHNRVRTNLMMAEKALHQTKRGAQSQEQYYLVPADQHDDSARRKFLSNLLSQKVEVLTLTEDTEIGGRVFRKGTAAIPLAQPLYAVVDIFFKCRPMPVTPYMPTVNGLPQLGIDTNVCVALCYGLETLPANEKIDPAVLAPYTGEAVPAPVFPLSGRENDSFLEVNRRLADGERVFRDTRGAFYTENGEGREELRRAKIGLLKITFASNEEEGYTRNLLRRYGFDYRIVMDKELREGRVPEVDILIIAGEKYAWLHEHAKPSPTSGYVRLPDEYYHAIDTEVAQATLRRFVEGGGRLIAWDQSVKFVSEVLDLGLDFPAWGKSPAEFATAGSSVRAHLDAHPYTRGLPETVNTTHVDSLIIAEPPAALGFTVFGRFADESELLVNGVTRGLGLLAGTPCALNRPVGDGEVVFYATDPQYRIQQDGTFKLLLNALYL